MALRTHKDMRKGSGRGPTASPRRSHREWFQRSALAVGFAVLGYMGVTSSLAHVVAKGDPASAHAMAPGNGIILAEYAQDTFTRGLKSESNSLAANLSRRALLAEPTAADALTVLGFQAQLRGDTEETDRIFSYSTALSRRELRPRVWAIEEAVGRGDIVGAIRNYDIALRTSKDAGDIFYPTLTKALSEPRIRSALLAILATDPVWKNGFIAYAADSGSEPSGTIALFREGRQIGLTPSNDLRANLVNVLMARNERDEAWTYYRTFRSGVRRDRSRDPKFALEATVRAVFDWQVGTDTRLSAAILREGDGGLLDFSAPPSTGGTLVSQLQLLPAGTYRIEGRSRGVEQPERSRPYWTLVCQDGRQLGRVMLPNSNQDGGRFVGRFTVPSGCEVQTLSLVARSTDDLMGVSGQILNAQLVPG
ncbi:hypothetical protein GCM10022600_02790 [Qipengyuania pelagi]|uniref:Tetratricopeptide repeat protein n=1 Tax=Qipengyuania pelagi TaxID=994320 RepID=A0A844YBQ4_9SPHN|nr:hypothetical protein [Qipengyuania pelagi]MXO54663.1 hypothetical protein [Qipengyuania pelagi]